MPQLDEIRMNRKYTSLSISDYENGNEKEESLPIINKRFLRTDEFMTKLKSNISGEAEYKVDHLFPPNCRYYEKHQEGHLVVIEEPPAFRTIAVEKDMSNEIECIKSAGKLEEYGLENWVDEHKTKPYMFNLAIPYSIFFLAFSSTYSLFGGSLFFRTHPISGFNDPLCRAPFLNINESQTICFGSRINEGPKRSIFADVNHAVGVFWSTIFNPDYIYNYVAYQGVAGLCDYLTWEYYSHADPMFIYNADWIDYKELNVGHCIDQTRQWIVSDRERNKPRQFGYTALSQLFEKQSERGIEKVPGVNIKEPLIYDVSQYIFNDDTSIHVGDSFKVKNGQYFFIDSFLGFRKMVNPTYVNIEREDGRIFRMKLTKKAKNYISDMIIEERFEAKVELPNGVILKSGDIIVMKNKYEQEVYRKIYYLRKTANGNIEGRFGSEFYFIENLADNVSVLNLDNPEYMGIILNKDDTYFVLRGSNYPNGPSLPVSFCNFKEVTTGSRNNLTMKFTESQGSNRGHNYSINFNEANQQRVFDIKNLRKLPSVFRVGKKLVYGRHRTSNDIGGYDVGEAYALPHLGVATPYNTTLRRAPYNMYQNKLIKNDTLKIESWDLDLEFSIGDKVVVSNWENPIDMLTVKQIEGFIEDIEDGSISFALVDKNEKLTKHLYITKNKTINIGTIRKITNTWGDLSAGMKIVANQSYISMFPKKDCNIIIGFLYDTGGEEPLVLCSNACTLWYSDVITKFNIIPMSHKKWNNLKHASINSSKMRFQAGDLLNGRTTYKTEMGYLAYRPMDSRTIRALQMSYFVEYEESYVFDRRFTREAIYEGFPNPRLTVSQEERLGEINAFPNFHGMYTETGKYFSRYLFTNEPRSILNVSNNSE